MYAVKSVVIHRVTLTMLFFLTDFLPEKDDIIIEQVGSRFAES